MKIMKILLLLVLIAYGISTMTYKDNDLDRNGVVIQRSDSNIILIKESIIVTLIYDISNLKSVYNKFIEKVDSIQSSTGDIDCLTELLAQSREKRFLIKEFIKTLNISQRKKRQAVSTIIGITGLISLGLSTVEAIFVNEKVEKMRNDLGKNEQKIHVLEEATSFNTNSINALIRAKAQTDLVLTSIKNQVSQEIHEINKLNREMICLNAKLTFSNLSVLVDKMLDELKNILNYHLDSRMISYMVRSKICKDIFGLGIKVEKNCNHFNLVEEVDFFMVNENNLVIFVKLPMLNIKDTFQILTLKALPIRIGKEFYKISNLEHEYSVAVGKRYRAKVNLNTCRRYNRHTFCSAVSEFRIKSEQSTCIGSILNKSSKVLQLCNVEKVKVMENNFIRTNSGKFYYSIKEPLKFEVLCKDSLNNDQFLLQGLGSVTIKWGCNGKLNNIFLLGSQNYEMNHTYHIEKKLEIANIKMPNFLNNTIIDIKPVNISKTNHMKFDTYDDKNFHYYIIYSIVSINILVLVIAIGVICIKQVYFVNHKVEANLKKEIENINLKHMNVDKNIQTAEIDVNIYSKDIAVNTDPTYNSVY